MEREWEPDESDYALMRYLVFIHDRFRCDCGSFQPEDGHITDPDAIRLGAAFDYEDDELIQMFAVALFLARRRLACRVLWPSVPLVLLLARLAAALAPARLAADGRPAAGLAPSWPLLLARSVLTAAPPARVPARAGTAG